MRVVREQIVATTSLLALLAISLLMANELDLCRCLKRPLFRTSNETELSATVSHVDWTADGTTVMIEARNWDSAASHLSVHRLGGQGYVPSWAEMVKDSLTNASMSPDGKSIVAATFTGELWWIDLETAAATELVSMERRVAFNVTAVSRDGQLMAGVTTDSDIYLCNPTQGTQKVLRRSAPDQSFRLHFSPDSRRLMSLQRDGSVVIWDTEAGESLCEITCNHHWPMTAAAFLHDGTGVICMTSEKQLRIWDIASNTERWRSADGAHGLSGVAAIDVASNGTLAAWSDAMTRRIIVWDLENQRIKYEIDNPSMVLNLKFSPDGNSLAVAGLEPIVRIYDVASAKETYQIDAKQIHETRVRT